MLLPTTRVKERAAKIMAAWNSMAPNASFAGISNADYAERYNELLELLSEDDALNAQRKAMRQRKFDLIMSMNARCNTIINGVKGHVEYGEDSPLYAAMGYITKSTRASGLTRGRINESGDSSIN